MEYIFESENVGPKLIWAFEYYILLSGEKHTLLKTNVYTFIRGFKLQMSKNTKDKDNAIWVDMIKHLLYWR